MPHKLYHSLAAWWPLLSPPEDYAEEAAFYTDLLLAAGDAPAATLLELGSGGGHNASFMKATFTPTLVDLSAAMLAHSRQLNPDCEHLQGDMRTLRLGRRFDRVFIHDAIAYMTTTSDLRHALQTAFVHCRPGGGALFAPDYVRDNFRPGSDAGGRDEDSGRGMRYLEWVHDPDPADTVYTVDYAYLMRETDGTVQVAHDRHQGGLFPRATWLELLAEAGFEAGVRPFEPSEVDTEHEVFVCRRPR